MEVFLLFIIFIILVHFYDFFFFLKQCILSNSNGHLPAELKLGTYKDEILLAVLQ